MLTISHRHWDQLRFDGLLGKLSQSEALRRHFEVDRHYIVLAALKALSDEGKLPAAKAAEAIKKYGIDINKPNPLLA